MRMVFRVLGAILLGVSLLPSGGCASRDAQLTLDSIDVAAGATSVDFSGEFDFDWDRVFVFGPYSTSEEVESSLGFDWREYADSSIEGSDSVCLVVFVADGSVAAWYDQPRSVDLIELGRPDGYSRGEAVFSVAANDGQLSLRE